MRTAHVACIAMVLSFLLAGCAHLPDHGADVGWSGPFGSAGDLIDDCQAFSDDDVRHRFRWQPEIDKFLAAHKSEVDNWLEGYARPVLGLSWPCTALTAVSGGHVLEPANCGDGIAAEWETAGVPAGFNAERATFVWMMVVDANWDIRPAAVSINGVKRFEIANRREMSWKVDGADSGQFLFDAIWRSKGQDRLFGYARLVAPRKWLTPGEPLRIRIAARPQDGEAMPWAFQYTDTAAWLRRMPRRAAFCWSAGTLNASDPVLLHVAARPEFAGKQAELSRGRESLGQAKLVEANGISVADIPVEAARVTGDERIDVLIDGQVQAEAPLDPVTLQARRLIARGHEVVALFRAGKVAAKKRTSAAMVMAWTDLLTGLFTADESRMLEVRDRAVCPAFACKQLAAALADFDAPHDVYATRRGVFERAYISTIDDSAQLYSVWVPPDYGPTQKYPLILEQPAGRGWHHVRPKRQRQLGSGFIYVRSSRRGPTGGAGLGELDALEIIKDVRARYSIDPDAISVTGASSGGYNTWRLCTRYPDLFAAGSPEMPFTYGMPLLNLTNVRLWVYHDDTDKACAVDNTRANVGYLAAHGHPVIYTEGHGGGHDIGGKLAEWDNWNWLWQQRRDPFPAQVCYTTPTPDRGRAYWLSILEFTDPNRPATLRASAPGNDLFLHLDNVDALAIEVSDRLFDRKRSLVVSTDRGPVTIAPPLPARLFVTRTGKFGPHGSYAITSTDPRTPPPYRPYVAGGLSSMYVTGEPLLIVKGTGGDDAALLRAIDSFCTVLSYRSTAGAVMPMGRIPVKADSELTPDDIQKRNLILVGPSSVNRYLARITGRLPAVESAGQLTIGRESYPLAGRSYGLFYYNPEAPHRLVCVMSAPQPGKFYEDLRAGVAGRITDDRPFGLVLVDVDPRRSVREIAWGKDWQPVAGAFDKARLPTEFAKTGTLHELEQSCLCRAAGADAVLHQAPEKPDAPAWDVAHARWHDARMAMGESAEAFVSTLTGAELRAALAAFKANERTARVAFWPAALADKLVPAARYRVAFEGDIVWAWMQAVGKPMPDIELVHVHLFAELERQAKRGQP